MSLADRVLRIEMWRDKAVTLAQQMNPGEYWSLDNVRMKVSNGGNIEGSFSEAAKARKLLAADLDTNFHFQMLLQCVLHQPGPCLLMIFLSWLTGGRNRGRRTTIILTCFRTSFSRK